jgi:hippurate hydrolase
MNATSNDTRGLRPAAHALVIALALALLSAGPPPSARRPAPGAGDKAGDETKEARPSLKDTAARVKKLVAGDYERLEKLYKHLHANPELSLQEVKTAARMAKELRDLGFDVTRKVGGTGVVGVFTNGKGPTVLVRCDMDALPIVEKTGLPYASKARTRDRNDREVGVMHACGHDVNMTCWVGTAKVLVKLKDRWKGTLLFVAQPAEEIGQGAKLMLNDGLYKRFGKPDYCLALHCDSQLAHGTLASREGPALANVDSVDVTLRGKGGHGAHPHTTIDPVVMAAKFVLDLQTLVSREVKPTDPAVVTVGSIHGGTKHNIVPDEVKLQLTVRSTKASTRKQLLDGIKRKAEAIAKGAGAPEPVVKIDLQEYTPALSNDVPLTRKMLALFRDVLGDEHVLDRPQVMGGEDFSRFALGGKVPLFIYFIGTAPPERVAAAAKEGGKPLPSLHSDQYYPVVEPTVKTGVLTLSMAVMHLLGG